MSVLFVAEDGGSTGFIPDIFDIDTVIKIVTSKDKTNSGLVFVWGTQIVIPAQRSRKICSKRRKPPINDSQ